MESNTPSPADAQSKYNAMVGYYAVISMIQGPSAAIVVDIARPEFADNILDIGAADGQLVGKVIERARKVDRAPNAQPGAIVAIDVAENFEHLLRYNISAADPTVEISVCNADAVQTTINQDNIAHAGSLGRGKARLYLGLGADMKVDGLMNHLAKKAPGGNGFDLVIANRVLDFVEPAEHVRLMRTWASALAKGGRLVVERSIYLRAENEPGFTHCPGQLVFKRRADNSTDFNVVSHRQCAPDLFWQDCEVDLYRLAAQAGLRVVRLKWANHGSSGEALGEYQCNIWDDAWEAELSKSAPKVPYRDTIRFLCRKVRQAGAETLHASNGKLVVDCNPVSVVAVLSLT